jgi:hypothetical protein
MAVRRVRRIIRRIDPWTVLKLAVVFNAIAALMFVLGTWVVWSLSLQRGIPDRLIEIFDRITLTLTIEGELYFRVIVLLAAVGAILMTGLMTLAAVLYNLIADLVGGVEITVLEETYNPSPTGTRTVLRPVARTQPVPAVVQTDGSLSEAEKAEVASESEVAGEPAPDEPAPGEPAVDDPGVGDDESTEVEPEPAPVAAADSSGNGSRPGVDVDGDVEAAADESEEKAGEAQETVPTA